MLANDSYYWVGSGWVQFFSLVVGWVGFGWVSQLMGWVGSGHTKWTHGQLWASRRARTLNRMTVRSVGRRSDRPVIGGDLVDGLVPAG